MNKIKTFEQHSEQRPIEMVFGDENTIFKEFDVHYEGDDEDMIEISFTDRLYLDENDGKARLTDTGFPIEWSRYVDYDKSYAFIKEGKLHVIVYGLPSYINKVQVEEYYQRCLDSYIDREYGEFFETEPGCPLCMVVIKNGKKRIV